MAVYCENHVGEEVERLEKLGEVEKIPTKEGTCGHLGGCNTGNVNLTELKCDYSQVPNTDEQKKDEGDEPASTTGSDTGSPPEEPPAETTIATETNTTAAETIEAPAT